MATLAPVAQPRDEEFFQKFTIGLSAFILFGFLQFAARGFVNYAAAPIIFHLHATAMVAWLALTIVQSSLAARDNLALHRKLGWASAVLATLIAPLAIATCFAALRFRLFPPFFTPAYFLSLVSVEGVAFTATIWAAIARRRRTEWHRRLIIAGSVLLMEPALGRLLPVPLIGGGQIAEWIAMVIQLLTLGILALHDRRALGRVHPATVAGMLIVFLAHVLVTIGGLLPVAGALAASA